MSEFETYCKKFNSINRSNCNPTLVYDILFDILHNHPNNTDRFVRYFKLFYKELGFDINGF
jgi:hypothetical protein